MYDCQKSTPDTCSIILQLYVPCYFYGFQFVFDWIQEMYIRVKRNKTTYFVQCDPTDTTLDIKQKLHALIDLPSNNQRLTLVATDVVLVDSMTLAEQRVTMLFNYHPELAILSAIS